MRTGNLFIQLSEADMSRETSVQKLRVQQSYARLPYEQFDTTTRGCLLGWYLKLILLLNVGLFLVQFSIVECQFLSPPWAQHDGQI